MKKCWTKSELLVDYIYGELDDRAKAHEVEDHIKTCPECAREAAELEAVLKAAKANTVDFSEDIWAMQRQNITRKIRKAAAPAGSFLKLLRTAFGVKVLSAAAAILVMAGVGTVYYRAVIMPKAEQPAISEKIELLQNLEIIERLDFYEKMSQKNG